MDRLERAKDYIAKGDGYYEKAADEIIAAREADPQLSYREIADRVGKGETWCRDLVRHRTNPRPGAETPFGGDVKQEQREKSSAKKVLAEAPLETIETIVMELSPERKMEIARALEATTVDRDTADEPTVEDIASKYPGRARDELEVNVLLQRASTNIRQAAGRIRDKGVWATGDDLDHVLSVARLVEEEAAFVRAAVQEAIHETRVLS